jgi:hypothetical protein
MKDEYSMLVRDELSKLAQVKYGWKNSRVPDAESYSVFS